MSRQTTKKPVPNAGKQVSAKAPQAAASKAGKKRRKGQTFADKMRTLLTISAVVLAASVSSLAVVYIFAVRGGGEAPVAAQLPPAPPPAPTPPPATTLALPTSPAAPPPTASAAQTPIAPVLPVIRQPEAGSQGTLVFVIDDAGNNLRDLQPFLDFPGRLTIAVLPGLPFSAEAARRSRAAGMEVFLHQPMESLGGTDPGPGAIMAGMGNDEIRRIINRNLDELWPVSGMNNHEGSRITMDKNAMETILSLSEDRGIVFLDSRTTAETQVPFVARQLGITIGERDIFIDNYPDRDSITYFINKGLVRAQQNGFAILIGHAWTQELAQLLKEKYPLLIQRGFSFSSVTDVLQDMR
ncbi:MAG: divergent polysaccharide deacetylase family protein [Treponema sp.]|nr:divergent polysaccharide deacetylase family protein [Treponema sp.]